MAETKIEWTRGPNGEQGFSFNPWVGCTKISPACDHCYAESWAKRSGMVQWGQGAARRRTSEANWRQPLKWDREAEKSGTNPRVFCASLADVFDNDVPQEWRRDLFDLIAETPNLDWLILTKRIGNVIRMLGDVADNRRPGSHVGDLMAYHWLNDRPPGHVWLGATICNQDEADRDIPKLLAVPAALHFVSIEPTLSAIDLRALPSASGVGRYLDALSNAGVDSSALIPSRIDWVIVGTESGPHARRDPAMIEWVRSLRDQCADSGVAFFWKQDVVGGKKITAPKLDGRTWLEFPR